MQYEPIKSHLSRHMLTFSQLHGATAVLEARLAYQQGERIKVLTYLAIIYLPLGTSAVRSTPQNES
jgi:hypothetical protein